MSAVSPTRRPLTEKQLLVLRYARHRKRHGREPFTFAELHAFMRRARGLRSVPNINRYVNRLVADGLIRRDGRKNAKLRIEPAGEALHDQLVGVPRPSEPPALPLEEAIDLATQADDLLEDLIARLTALRGASSSGNR
jgi:DNA-binding MarR family transcriptional regulator